MEPISRNANRDRSFMFTVTCFISDLFCRRVTLFALFARGYREQSEGQRRFDGSLD